jgi:hypothetical protein
MGNILKLQGTPSAFTDAYAKGAAMSTTLVRNKLAQRVMAEGKIELPRVWTGTVVAYPGVGAAFGDSLAMLDRYGRLRFVLDTMFVKGERGAAIVLEAGTYDIQGSNGERVFVPKSRPSLMGGFPQEDGWFDEDRESGLPVLGTARRLYLWRLPAGGIVPVARERGGNEWAMSDVFLNQRPSSRLVPLFVSEAESLLSARAAD